VKVGDLVRLLREPETLGIVIGFDEDGDPVVRYIGHMRVHFPEAEYAHAVEVLSECR